ncbi:MAG TPA: hypothetical protein VFA09_26875 [Ktedonobacteraceae bacterium]|nr:hypothetical protein [Ktedonobacteraceae bacterium]
MSELTIHGETAEALMTSMQAHGFTVTRPELARWHRAGLLPRPERHSRGRGRGMVSIYPHGTADQLLALCEIHHSEKRLPFVAWRLWWVGYDVPMRYAWQFLEEATASWRQGIEHLQELQEHPELLTALFDRKLTKTLARARKRVGRRNFPTFIGVLFRIATGTFEGYAIDPETGTDSRERTIVENGFGLRRARTERVGGAKPWLAGEDISEAFKMCSVLLGEHPPGEHLAMAQDTDLMGARDEVRSFLAFLESCSASLDELLGRGALGLSVFANLIREMRPPDQAMMLLFWRMFRMWGLGDGMDALLVLARQWQQVWLPIFRGLKHLREEVPATAEVLGSEQLGDALHRPAAMEYALDLARHLAQQYAPEVEAFLAHRPELSQALEASTAQLKSQT